MIKLIYRDCCHMLSKTICFLLGTRAQLIKTAPVALACHELGLRTEMLWTGQHRETIDDLLADFGLQDLEKEALYQGPEVNSIGRVAPWAWQCFRSSRQSHRMLFARYGVIVTHGDTFSTVLAAWLGRKSGIPVAHIEAGLRSFNLLNPFPEEINRLLTFRWSDIAYHPGEWAGNNLHRYKWLERIDTGQNTIVDAVRLALGDELLEPPEQPYAVCSIHRFENIFFTGRLKSIIAAIEAAAEQVPIRFVLHSATRKRLEATGLLQRLQAHPGIELLDRMGYFKFVRLLAGARFVITDGGSNQEELSLLQVPTLIMRDHTERQEGLGSTAQLVKPDPGQLRTLIATLPVKVSRRPQIGGPSPASIIAQHLAQVLVKSC
ncbi:UDP-N-acetylglucosamine 2-epimerase [Chitiniphilus purpureus]|uniref:UDP-N-acetylglucosamine 2-epimerase n=1 Tax=Chitiniphilus purpureus TaxID=2981137 RepID=A0ABY6DMM3_9NEIS|nr:UDP-N-acetylglucosamine 2-epimerase [Chitiniphilus sp. CD1]UXY15620.1 UDP-N-acetylglucosamine 2-epimerase [Chitiniphilus sp. CD1]